MREAIIVARRELKGYFASPIAYVFGALFLAVQLWFSTLVLQQGMPARMEAFFGLLPLVFLVFLPPLTMRLWSEERKLGTLELLMTFPVRIGGLIAGKFAAAMLFLALLLLLTVGLPMTMAAYGQLDWGPVIAAYFASLLLAGAYVAVGMFFSSLTRDQIVALLLAVVFLGALYFAGMDVVGAWLRQAGAPEFVTQILAAISPRPYFLSIARGVIDVGDLVYYAAFCGFFLQANALVLASKRQSG